MFSLWETARCRASRSACLANWGDRERTEDGGQGGDPAKLAKALVQLTNQDGPPLRWAAGADAVEAVEQKANDLLAQAEANRDLSSSLAHDDAT
jgi:hypothetical protein